MKKVLVNKPIHADALKLLSKEVEVLTPFHLPSDEIMQFLPEIHGIILCAGMKMTAEEINLAEKLEVIGRHGAGLDIVDLKEATQRNIPVVYTPHGPTESTAEHAFALMMAIVRKLPYLDRETRSGNFHVRDSVVGFELLGASIGVVGFGRIGQRFAEMCRSAFQTNTSVFDPFVSKEKIEDWGAVKYDNIVDLMSVSDVVSLHLPSTKETHYLIDQKALEALGPDGYLVNAARGAVVDESALVHALKEGIIAGAGLDVFDPEPPEKDNPLFELENVVLTPHLASFTNQGRRRMGLMVVEDVLKVLNGDTPKYPANSVVINQDNKEK